MPKNKGKGGKNRKRGTNKNEPTKRELIIAQEGQTYAIVEKILGNGRVTCKDVKGKVRLGIIRGKMRKKVWINSGDIVLLSIRDFQDDKADIIGKYRPEEIEKLVKKNLIPESFSRETSGGGSDTLANNIIFVHDRDQTQDEPEPQSKKPKYQYMISESESDEDYEEEEDFESVTSDESEPEPEPVRRPVYSSNLSKGKGLSAHRANKTAAAALNSTEDINFDDI